MTRELEQIVSEAADEILDSGEFYGVVIIAAGKNDENMMYTQGAAVQIRKTDNEIIVRFTEHNVELASIKADGE